jgi:NADPH:quinone reductase-like Zn-dependent oxidoreductase
MDIPEMIAAVTAQADRSLRLTQVPAPKIVSPDDVIVKVYSLAQNPTDWKSLEQGRIPAGRILGTDIAGIVVATGDAVTHVKVGDRVCYLVRGG